MAGRGKGPFQNCHIVDSVNCEYALKVNEDGSINVSGGGGGGSLPTTTDNPTQDTAAVPVVAKPQKTFRTTFARSIAGGIDTTNFDLKQLGTGMTINQSNGNLLIASGTRAGQETVIRSKKATIGAFTLRDFLGLNTRSANVTHYVEMVDIIGDGLAFNINSATSVTVTIPNNTFDATNIGQSMNLGIIQGAAGLPGRYAISGVSGNDVTFTVAGWPASGSGTLSLFGWNYHRITYDGTSGAAAKIDSQRAGWNSGDTFVTINNTSPGHVSIMNYESGIMSYLDQLPASNTGLQTIMRGSRVQNIPDDETVLYMQIRVVNLTGAVNVTTTVGFVYIEDYIPQQMSITSARSESFNSALPVSIVAGSNGQATGFLAVNGTPRGASNNGGGAPLYVATGYDGRPAQVTNGRNVDLQATRDGVLITKPYALPLDEWVFSGAAITTTSNVVMAAAPAAGLRRYITGVQIDNNGVNNVVEIKDGSTVIWRGSIAANTDRDIIFATPLRATAATALNVATLTAGSVFVNAQGYIGV